MTESVKLLLIAMIGIAAAAIAANANAADVKAGKKVFRKCKACHVVDKEQNRVGPHLVGIFGRAAGAVDDYKYSEALLASGITWDAETIGAYLADPKGYIADNKMSFPGLKKEQDIANVIAYLEEATSP